MFVAKSDKKIYRQHRPLRTIAVTLAVLVILAALLALTVFFSFKKYIVYTSDGVRLDVPWLQETVEEPYGDTEN